MHIALGYFLPALEASNYLFNIYYSLKHMITLKRLNSVERSGNASTPMLVVSNSHFAR